MIRRLAIIPARGGSKRIPNKNIRDFCGKPMIAHILQTARASGLFDVIHVSTDSLLVKEVVEKLGFSIDFMRPAELADDHARYFLRRARRLRRPRPTTRHLPL